MTEIGAVTMIPEDDPIPDGWVLLGTEESFESSQWPEFVEALRIQGPTFTLPMTRQRDGWKSIIKMGVKQGPVDHVGLLQRVDPEVLERMPVALREHLEALAAKARGVSE